MASSFPYILGLLLIAFGLMGIGCFLTGKPCNRSSCGGVNPTQCGKKNGTDNKGGCDICSK